MSVTEGEIIGGCEIGRLLGSGGLGSVFKALHRQSGRTVALKVLAAHMAAKPGVVERFEREARLCFQLDHPHLIAVHTWGEDDGRHYMAMEYVAGSTLEALSRRRDRLTWPMAASIVADVASGLEHVHRLDIVHRDIKPANMLVGRGGRAKLADLGLARDPQDGLGLARRLTTEGAAIGSPAYMAPEQINDTASVDAAADVYGLGASLYQGIVGRPPLIGDSPLDTCRRVLRDRPEPVANFHADVPEALSQLIDACLDKQPERRPASAVTVSEQLRALIGLAGYRPGTQLDVSGQPGP
ncbi:MAG: serine/threonine-protein kinase [Planctomycetota bacterium]